MEDSTKIPLVVIDNIKDAFQFGVYVYFLMKAGMGESLSLKEVCISCRMAEKKLWATILLLAAPKPEFGNIPLIKIQKIKNPNGSISKKIVIRDLLAK